MSFTEEGAYEQLPFRGEVFILSKRQTIAYIKLTPTGNCPKPSSN